MDVYFILWLILHYYGFWFCCSNYSSFGALFESSFRLASVFSWHTSLFHFPCPSSGINHFSKEITGPFCHHSNQVNFLGEFDKICISTYPLQQHAWHTGMNLPVKASRTERAVAHWHMHTDEATGFLLAWLPLRGVVQKRPPGSKKEIIQVNFIYTTETDS